MSADASQLRALSVTLRGQPAKARTLASQIIRKSGFDIAAQSKARAQQLFKPPPEGTSTGATANSIKSHMKGDLEVEVGPTTYYAPFLEFGHRTRGGGFVAPKPFMGPGFDAVMPSVEAAFGQLGDLT